MSERDDRDVLALLDRAAAHTPPLHLTREDVVERGEQIVRRRRAGVRGMALAAVALVVTVWLGLGQGALMSHPEVVPASVTWEVEEPTEVTLVEDVGLQDRQWTVRLAKDENSSVATFVVNGEEERVPAARFADGAEAFVGRYGTLVVWAHPDAASHDVELVPTAVGGNVTGRVEEIDGQEIGWLLTDARGYLPQDILFHTDHDVWTAGGEVAATARVSDGRYAVDAFDLPGAGLAGYLTHGSVSLMETGTVGMSGATEPWWRGGDSLSTAVYRVPAEARWVRPVWSLGDPSAGQAGEPVETVRVGDSGFAVDSWTQEELDPDGIEIYGRFQWSADGRTWQEMDEDAPTDSPPPPSGLDVVEFTVGEDREPVASIGSRELPLLPEQPAGEAWAWDDDGETVALVSGIDPDLPWFPVVRSGDQIGAPASFQDHETPVLVGDEQMLATRLPAGTTYLGGVAAEDRDGRAGRFLDGDPVETQALGALTVAVDEEQGLFLATRSSDSPDVEPS